MVSSPFLVQTGTDAAVFDTTGKWVKILEKAKLDASSPTVESTDNQKDVTVKSTEDLWEIQFSSSGNATYLGPEEDAKLKNHAWVGDELISGVMVLDSTNTPQTTLELEFPLRKDDSDGTPSIYTVFKITDTNDKLKKVIDILDKFKVKLHNTTKPDPNPNALWCMATEEGYSTIVKLEFIFTVSDAIDQIKESPFGQVAGWVEEALGLHLNTDGFKSIPPIYISTSSTVNYTIEGDEVVESEPIWGVSVQFEVFGMSLAIDFSAKDTTFYLLPTAPTKDIVGSIISAVGQRDDIDEDQIPKQGGDDVLSKLSDHLNLWYVHFDKDVPSEEEPADKPVTEDEPAADAEKPVDKPSPENEAAVAVEGKAVASKAGSKGAADTGPKLMWGIGILAHWQIDDEENEGEKKNVLIGLTYESRTKTFNGNLITQGDPVLKSRRDPTYDHRLALPWDALDFKDKDGQPVEEDGIPEHISLWKLFSGEESGDPPAELKKLPLNIQDAELTYQILGDGAADKGSVMTFYMNLVVSAKSGDDAKAAPTGFVWSKLSILASKMKMVKGTPPKTSSAQSLQIFSSMELVPKSQANKDKNIPSAILDLGLSYSHSNDGVNNDTTWILEASLQDLSVALLADYFFDNDCSDGALAVLGSLNLSSVKMIYTYNSGVASSFLISAIITLGELELDLSYQYVSEKHTAGPTAATRKWAQKPPSNNTLKPLKETGYRFQAFLRINDGADQASTIRSITESISPGNGDMIPDFIANIEIKAKGDADNAPIKLSYSGGNKIGSTLIVWVRIGPFNLTFIQYRSPVDPTKNPPTVVKRLVRISADQIPMLDKVPLINELPQPFDHLIYLWVDDPEKKGFTRTMIEKNDKLPHTINNELATMGIPEIQLKESKKAATDVEAAKRDIVLQHGHHFIVIAAGKVVLDHVFQPEQKKPVPANKSLAPPPPATDAAPAKPTPPKMETVQGTPENAATKGNVDTKAGPLSISALSLQYKNGSLFVGADATLVLGPLTFSVIGFTIELELNKPGHKLTLNNLASIITDGLIHVSIHGLEAGLDKPPLTLKGVFIHDTAIDVSTGDSVESYRGGIAVGIKAWKVLAVGEYAIVTKKTDKSQYKSVFIYGKLDGPLVTLEFATISGVRLGFGYNSLVRLPKVDQLYQFPFIADSAAGDDPLKILNALKEPINGNLPFVYTKEGGVWFAAGMTITAFDCLTLTAVLMFEIETKSDQNGVIIALLADGVFQMPPEMPADLCLFYIELLIKVELNFIEGYICADAALAPASHVYVPFAHLTGSASFYSWFAPNAHSGDWVVTIGGYHKAYTPPDHYPQRLARLGLNFVVGNGIHVVGGAYVAVTPKCAMAGGSLHISLDVGPVSAFADIALDVFINFKPFYFIAEMRLSVGIDCDVDLGLISFHISISLGADLTLWGPNEFGGIAHVHFWFFGFSIDFGSGLDPPPGVPLVEFYEMIRTSGPPSDPPPGDTTSSSNLYQAQHKYSIEDGLFPAKPQGEEEGKFPNTGATTEWKVFAGPLKIRIDSDFSLSEAHLVTDEKDITKGTEITTIPKTTLNSIYSFAMHNTEPISSSLAISIYFMESIDELQTDWRAELVVKAAPKAVWSKYTSDNDPLSRISGKVNKPKALEKGEDPTVDLCQGVRLLPPLPVLCKTKVVDFDATAAMMQFEEDTMIPFAEEQTVFLAEVFEKDKGGKEQWDDFGKVWKGQIESSNDEGIEKKDIRGDDGVGIGMMGLVAEVLGWAIRGPAEMVGGTVPDVMVKDVVDLTKMVVQRKEWELVSKPPTILADELEYYYPALPMVTAAA